MLEDLQNRLADAFLVAKLGSEGGVLLKEVLVFQLHLPSQGNGALILREDLGHLIERVDDAFAVRFEAHPFGPLTETFPCCLIVYNHLMAHVVIRHLLVLD